MSKINEPIEGPRSLNEMKLARETRANETLKMKDEQIKVLTEQNNKLIESLNRIEEESSTIQMEKIAIEEENRALRDNNLESRSKARAADEALQKIKSETSDRDKQLAIMTEQNGELLRLLETEEANNARLASENETQTAKIREYREKYELLEKVSKEHQDISSKATYEGHLKSEEARILKAEVENLKNNNSELQMKTSVEIEALQEQLRVRKEKQYQLLEKLQVQEEARRQAEDQVVGMEERIRELNANKSQAETKLQLEINSKLSQLDANKKLSIDTEMLSTENKELIEKLKKTELDRLRMEAEARDSGEQLREMAEKVFQLLERLKLAELAKTRSMDALRKKDQEVQALKKKNTHLIKENTKEGKARMKVDLEKRDLEEQMRSLKKHNNQLAIKCKEECKLKFREEEGRKESQEKITTLNARISFLLNKLQTDEEAKKVQRDEIVKMEAQLATLLHKCEEFQEYASELEESKKKLIEELHMKKEEIQALQIQVEAFQKVADEQDEEENKRQKLADLKAQGKSNDGPEHRLAGGKLRFFVDSKPTLGMVLIKAKCASDREWLEGKGCNAFLKRSLKNRNPQEMLIQKLSEMYGVAITEEEELNKMKGKLQQVDQEVEIFKQKNTALHKKISDEEDSKRRTLIRYVNAVKASVSLGEPESEKDRQEVGRIGAGRIHLPEANLTDEETHAIAATLRGNLTVVELNLRKNNITDDGAGAIASILSGQTALKLVDLRYNHIGRLGLKTIAEALERSGRVRHVYVHVGGKIEALGTGNENSSSANSDTIGDVQPENTADESTLVVKTVCIVDIRDNNQNGATNLGKSVVGATKGKKQNSSQASATPFQKKSSNNYVYETEINKTVDKARRKANEHMSKEERERKRKAKQLHDAIEREKLVKEQGWMGRSGGMDNSISMTNSLETHPRRSHNGQKQKKAIDLAGGFPPARPRSAGCSLSVSRSNSAPGLSGPPTRSEENVTAETSTMKRNTKLQMSPFIQENSKK